VGVGWYALRQGWGGVLAPLAAPAAAGTAAASAFTLPTAYVLGSRAVGIAEAITWAVPFLPVLAAVGWWSARRGSPLRLLGSSVAVTLLAYCFVRFDQGHGWGFRYLHAAWGALPLLAAAALVAPAAARWRSAVLAGALLAIPAANGLRAAQVGSFVREH